tara:strand:+ start:316 stop:1035 length:720 start_codon:yes stop_codon:yes gene_type:complete
MKKCNNPKCKITNPKFNKNKNNKDGLSNRCRDCVKKSVKKSYNKNRQYYIEEETKRSKEWREANPELYNIQRKKWNEKYKEDGYFKQYYKNNKEKITEYYKLEDVVERRKKRWRERYYTDIPFRLKEILQANFHLFFKDKGKNKTLSFTSVIDYTYEEFKEHLTKNFRKGMNWDNFGEMWEIHHIKPQSMFDTENIDDIRKCWELNNMIPLWKTTEISKQMGDTTIGNRNVPKDKIYQP